MKTSQRTRYGIAAFVPVERGAQDRVPVHHRLPGGVDLARECGVGDVHARAEDEELDGEHVPVALLPAAQ